MSATAPLTQRPARTTRVPRRVPASAAASAASAVRTAPRTAPRTGQAPAPSLRLVPTPRRVPPRAPFAIMVVAVLIAGLLGLLALNTMLAQGSFQLHALQTRSTALAEREQLLQQQVDAAQAPTALALAATALGMVPGGPPLFLRSTDGAVLGDPTAKGTSTALTDALTQLQAQAAAAAAGSPTTPSPTTPSPTTPSPTTPSVASADHAAGAAAAATTATADAATAAAAGTAATAGTAGATPTTTTAPTGAVPPDMLPDAPEAGTP
jgi:hypothetical protein